MLLKLLNIFSIVLFSFNYTYSQKQNDNCEYEMNKIKEVLSKKRDSLSPLYKNYYLSIDSNNDTLIKKMFRQKINELDVYTEEINKKEINAELNFINKNLSSIISADLLIYRLKRREGLKLYDTIYNIYNKFSKFVKSSSSGINLNQALINYKNSNINSNAIDFTLVDINNEQISLNSFKNKKYVLIDFWASWCEPCREEFPFLKKIYSKYKNNGFEIISISRDENLDSWRNTILKDKTNEWKNISIKLNKSDIENKYFVNAIPVKILINKEGVIVGRWRGGGEENKKDLLRLLTQIFNE